MRFARPRELSMDTEPEHPASELSARGLRETGDSYRDRRMWSEAARCYREYLAETPGDAAIWVQLGHCLKESGSYHEAESAYDRALALTPADDDIYLQKGHLAKLMGSTNDAIYFYKRSLALRQDDNDALRELLTLGAFVAIREVLPADAMKRASPQPTLYLDITDLIEYAKQNPSLSGIQRVVGNLAKWSTAPSAGADLNIRLVVPEYDRGRIFVVNSFLVSGLIDLLQHSGSDRGALDATIQSVYESRLQVTPVAGDLFVIAGAFWIYDHYDMIAALRIRGVKFGVFIHDLIQLKNPEYVHKEATLVFRKSLIDIMMVANFVLTNSGYVAREVEDFLRSRLNISLPVKAIPLATELRATDDRDGQIATEIIEVSRDEYVLCVCTIEVRKNHVYLIRIWERLIKELGNQVPRLVFVGKWGWDVEVLQEYLANTDALDNWLHIFNGISDRELEYLYKHCLFTVFVSFAEGWGLPVGESLAHGKLCVASNAASIPEVGGDLVRYVDPFDVQDGYRAIKQLVTDRVELNRFTQRVQREFRPKSWRAFCAEFFGAIDEFRQGFSDELSPNNCKLPTGELLFIGDDDVSRLDASGSRLITARMTRAGGWHPVEHWGVWASERRARIRFLTELAEGDAVKIYLRLQQPPGSKDVRCLLRVGGIGTVLDTLSTHATFYQAEGRVATGGALEISLAFTGKFGKPDHRELYLGLSALGFCRSEDPLDRVALLEKVTLCQIVHPRFSLPIPVSDE
jgi:glycosyltransferase involved in cell wall biosynthesis